MRIPILIAAVALIAASFSFAQVADFDGDGDVDIRDFAIEQRLATAEGESIESAADQIQTGGIHTGGFQVGITCPRTVVIPGGELEYEITGELVIQNSAGLAL